MNHSDLVDRYIAIWNETDAALRRQLIARTWTRDANYVDPVMQGDGHAGIDAMVKSVQERYPGHRFRLTGGVDAHNDRIRFSWEFAPAAGEPLVKGTDFAVLADDRLAEVTGFFDAAPAST